MKFFETIHMDEDLSESKDEVRRKIRALAFRNVAETLLVFLIQV